MVAPPLDAKRPTRGIRARAQAASAQARPLDAALCCSRHLPLHSTCATRRCAVRVAPRPERGPVARESAAKVHDQSTGAATPLEPHGNVRCQARGSTSESTHVLAATPGRLPHRANAAARVLREFFAWPAARLVARACCACVLRWRATRVAARPPRGALLPQRRHEPRSWQPTHSRPSAPRCRRCLGRRRGARGGELLRSQAGGGGPAGGCAQLAAWRGRRGLLAAWRGRRLCSRRSARRDDAATAICA